MSDTQTKTFRVLITGTRNELTTEQAAVVWHEMDNAIEHIPLGDPIVFIHGACPTGVDAQVEIEAPGFETATTERHPADWKTHGRAAGPIRNREMVELGADICLAFPMGASRGTRGCIALAQAAGIPTTVVEL